MILPITRSDRGLGGASIGYLDECRRLALSLILR